MELASRAGVSLATVQELVQGVPRRRQPRTLAAVSEALGWSTDHLALVLRGRAHDFGPYPDTAYPAEPPDVFTGGYSVGHPSSPATVTPDELDPDAELRAIRKELAALTQRLDATERFAGQLQAQLIGLYGRTGPLTMTPER